MTTADIFSSAMNLPEDLRAELAVQLMDSLDAGEPELEAGEWERAWGAEIAARIKALDAGEMETIPADEVMAAARARLRTVREG